MLNFAFLSFVDRLIYNDLGAHGVISYFHDSSKRVGIFLGCLGFVKLMQVKKRYKCLA